MTMTAILYCAAGLAGVPCVNSLTTIHSSHKSSQVS